jgi:hypothetical protein
MPRRPLFKCKFNSFSALASPSNCWQQGGPSKWFFFWMRLKKILPSGNSEVDYVCHEESFWSISHLVVPA